MPCPELTRITLAQLASAEPIAAAALQAHLASCQVCLAEHDVLRQDWARLARAGQAMSLDDSAPSLPVKRRAVLYIWSAVAAAVFIITGLVATRWNRPARPAISVGLVAWPELPKDAPPLLLLDVTPQDDSAVIVIADMQLLERVSMTVPVTTDAAPSDNGAATRSNSRIGAWRIVSVQDAAVEVQADGNPAMLSFDHAAWDRYFATTYRYFENRLQSSAMQAEDWGKLAAILKIRDLKLAGFIQKTANDSAHPYHAEAAQALQTAGPGLSSVCRLWQTLQTGSHDSRLQSLRTLISMNVPEAREVLREALTKTQDPLWPVIVEELLQHPDPVTHAQLTQLVARSDIPEPVRAMIEHALSREKK